VIPSQHIPDIADLTKTPRRYNMECTYMPLRASQHIVRGYGPLDLYLAKKRCKMAIRHLREVQHRHRILDIGCGAYPLFLSQIDFAEKYGVDQGISDELQKSVIRQGIVLTAINLHKETVLPWEDNWFDAVSMLAVIEHIEMGNLPSLLREIYRVLRPHGRCTVTTPAPWADSVLRLLATLRVISATEIDDHKGAYNHRNLKEFLVGAGFTENNMKFGYFELFLNLWAYADK
jgi:SAM-dependent methyltransferase